MRAGLITFHRTPSMGGNLQGVALYTLIKDAGYRCEIIDYRREYEKNEQIKVQKNVSAKKRLIWLGLKCMGLLNRRSTALRAKRICKFQDTYMEYTNTVYKSTDELKQNPPQYDVYVTGSDQVWNPVVYHLEAYFLTFAPEDKNTVAYAPSIGISELSAEHSILLREWTKGIKHLSCREDVGTELLRKVTQRTVTHVLDPTLVINKERWAKYAVPYKHKKPYLICYFLGSMKYGRKIAERIARKKGLQLIVIQENPIDMFNIHKKAVGVGPAEFLGMFLEADYICTDSFHGTAFSINFNKPFVSMCRRNHTAKDSNLSRIQSIVRTLGCEERLILSEKEFSDRLLNMDFTEVNKKLKQNREVSMDYLKRSMADES